MSQRGRLVVCLCAVAGGLLAIAPGAVAKGLDWEPCGEAGAQCATATVPRDYDKPHGTKLHLDVAKSPATGPGKRIGSLFINFGGPGAPTTPDVVDAGPDLFPVLNQRFDIVGVDPRGTDVDTGIDCAVNQETDGIYSEPFTTPFSDVPTFVKKVKRYVSRCASRNADILPYAATANVARDMDLVREAVGDPKLTYLGFSYGTFLGATYASLFPGKMRALALDGPVDADNYINDPMRQLREQTAGFERALNHFFQACAADQEACSGFGGSDPLGAFDELVEQANAAPIPAPGYTPDPRPITGDDLLNVAFIATYDKGSWGDWAAALSEAAAGDGTVIRAVVDEAVYGRDPETGAYDPGGDRYFTLGAIEQNYRNRNVGFYLDAGEACWSQYEHFLSNCGYLEHNYGLFPIRARDVFRGPFRVPSSAATPLIIDTTYDPATPYRGGLLLARDLRNARVLTMRGDGHTAYGRGSADCIDPAIENYLINRVLPPKGKKCKQELPFTAPQQAAKRAAANRLRALRPHVRPGVR
jgi:pimeloyl-ACP methyl ester carboxylesterase